MSFLELSEQERVEALTSGIDSTEFKAATLWAMKQNVAYSSGRLATEVYSFLGSEPASRPLPFIICKQSLEPIGMVVRYKLTGDLGIEFEKTEDGFVFGHPAIARFLFTSDKLGISFKKLAGEAQTIGAYRHAYIVAMLLERLRDGELAQTARLSEALGMPTTSIGGALGRLSDVGLIDYERIRYDSHGNSEKGTSVATLISPDLLEYYTTHPEMLRAAVRNIRPYFRSWGYLERVVDLQAETLEHSQVAGSLAIRPLFASAAIRTLCELGVYEARFGNRSPNVKTGSIRGVNRSSARITESGKFAYDHIFGPILAVAREPASGAVMREFMSMVGEIDVSKLFRNGIKRYLEEKRSGPDSSIGTDTKVYDTIASVLEAGSKPPRVKEIGAELSIRGVPLTRPTIDSSLKRLLRDGRVEQIIINDERASRYRLKSR